MTTDERKRMEFLISGWIVKAFPDSVTRPPFIQERLDEALALAIPTEGEHQLLEKIACSMLPKNRKRFYTLIAEDAREKQRKVAAPVIPTQPKT